MRGGAGLWVERAQAPGLPAFCTQSQIGMDIYTTQNFKPSSPGGAGQCPAPRHPSVQRDVGVHFPRGMGSVSAGNIRSCLTG